MKFDLFDAAAMMKAKFGEDSEVLVRNTPLGIAIRMQVYEKREWHHREFTVSQDQIDSDEDVLLINMMWKRGMAELAHYIENYKVKPL